MDKQTILSNVALCQAQLDQAAKPGTVEIMAVTKTMSAEICNMVMDAGIARIGENRVQELIQKLPALNPGFTIELIGQLQTNKVKYIVDSVSRVQSLDRMALAQELDRRCQMAGKVMPCLVEVNVAGEAQRAGMDESELMDFVHRAAQLPGIRIEGLMAVMPIASNPEDVRHHFRRMRMYFDRLTEDAIDGVHMETLSMGMTHDYLIAAQEGATQVRLGSAIFGTRAPLT